MKQVVQTDQKALASWQKFAKTTAQRSALTKVRNVLTENNKWILKTIRAKRRLSKTDLGKAREALRRCDEMARTQNYDPDQNFRALTYVKEGVLLLKDANKNKNKEYDGQVEEKQSVDEIKLKRTQSIMKKANEYNSAKKSFLN